MRPSPITPTIDLDAPGVRHGHLRLPYSHDASAWGSVMIPITVACGGSGPTALLTGGNHGDEYEGPIALTKLAYDLESLDIAGRVIVVPFMNHPGCRAGTRTSPIDRGNLNRLFPGRPDGSVTEKIADFFTRHLVPTADLVLDFHSGGRTLDFLPFAASHALDDAEQEARCTAAMRAFRAPYAVRLREIDPLGMYDTTVEALGKTFVTTELRGGGTASAASVRIAERGVRNLLVQAGILEGEIEGEPSLMLDMPSDACFVLAEAEGMVELTRDLGEPVRAGETIARIHTLQRTGVAPVAHHAGLDGILVARHFPGLVQTGDCLAVIAVPAEG